MGVVVSFASHPCTDGGNQAAREHRKENQPEGDGGVGVEGEGRSAGAKYQEREREMKK